MLDAHELAITQITKKISLLSTNETIPPFLVITWTINYWKMG
jgi:hypothetical protein